MSSHITASLPPLKDVSLADRRPNAFKPPSRMTFLTIDVIDVGAVSDKSNHRLMVGGYPLPSYCTVADHPLSRAVALCLARRWTDRGRSCREAVSKGGPVGGRGDYSWLAGLLKLTGAEEQLAAVVLPFRQPEEAEGASLRL